MEFKTSQGGETTLVFDEGEQLQLDDIAQRLGKIPYDVKQRMVMMRQANPLADFDGLLMLAFPQIFNSSLFAERKLKAKQLKADPLDALEADIRRKLATVSAGPVGSTSQTMQVEATLLQALATALLGRVMRDFGVRSA